MNLLLDTHVFLWWIAGEPLPEPADAAIRNPDHAVWLSAASAWEITIKVGLGKLRLPDRAARFIDEQRRINAFGWLPIETAALDILQDLPFHHRDPFDRLLIAQAIAQGYTLRLVRTRLSPTIRSGGSGPRDQALPDPAGRVRTHSFAPKRSSK